MKQLSKNNSSESYVESLNTVLENNEFNLTDNELEVLKRVPRYKKGKRLYGIVNSYSKNVPKLINKFINFGLLKPQTKEDYLGSLNMEDLKTLLKNQKLKTSGHKADLINRIIREVPEQDYINSIISDVYCHSDKAKVILNNYEIRKNQEKIKFENKCINLIRNKQIQTAYEEICIHKLNTINGSMIDWESEFENGLPKEIEKILVKLLNFNKLKLEISIKNRTLFNATCIYCYLSGINPNKILTVYSSVYNINNIKKEELNRYIFYAHYLTNIISSYRDIIGYKNDGVKKYRILCALDTKTCEICGEMDGQIFNVNEAKLGINLPPFCDKCRCTTTPVYDPIYDNKDDLPKGMRTARDPKTGKTYKVPADMTYKEWYKKYVSKK